MPKFKGTDFEIELPTEFTDESTYAFALRARADFRPSITVKTERLKDPTELPAYVEKQLENIKKLLPDVAVVSGTPAKHGDFPAHISIYDWGDKARRVRQKQHYVLLRHPDRVVTLTGTSLRETFDQTEELFDAIFRSFKPIEQHPKGA